MEIILIILGTGVVVGGAVFFAMRAQGGGSARELLERIERVEQSVKSEIGINRKETNDVNRGIQKDAHDAIRSFDATLRREFEGLTRRLADISDRNETKMNEVRSVVETRLERIRQDNEEKLERMRATVDEKLHATLEKRLSESFKLVGAQLESVQRGLGEMQTLATGVGDLKKVLQNVKTRGTWGEVQLENILDDILTPEQYEKNVATKQGSNDRVEFAIKLPSKDRDGQYLLLPIDAKFPLEDYQALSDASDRADVAEIESAFKRLEIRMKGEAKDISRKYLDPPHTTDFGILFLPVEGLYAEALRRPGLAEAIRREYNVILTGPTTITALLNSLQMGFRTLAIEKRSSEVWAVLGSLKKEFTTFGTLLDKTRKKIQEAGNTLDTASQKSRTIERVLGKVQELPTDGKREAPQELAIGDGE